MMEAVCTKLHIELNPAIGRGRRPAANLESVFGVSDRGRSEESARRLEDLVCEYGHVVRTAVRKASGGRSGLDVEDVEQSVLLEVWKQVRREQEIRFPSSYLYRAAIRETVRLIERQRKRKEESLDTREGTPRAAVARTAVERRAKVESIELREAIAAGLGGLRPDRRKAVEGHLAGYRVGEIMQRYDWSYGRARNLIARGMADLRGRLRDMGVGR